jgi:uncharacterized membrane protein
MKKKVAVLFGLTVLALVLALTGTTPAAPHGAAAKAVPAASASSAATEALPPEPHPHIRAALHELHEAQGELKRAAHDFGGHREEALEAVDKAIHQLEVCLKYDKD